MNVFEKKFGLSAFFGLVGIGIVVQSLSPGTFGAVTVALVVIALTAVFVKSIS